MSEKLIKPCIARALSDELLFYIKDKQVMSNINQKTGKKNEQQEKPT